MSSPVIADITETTPQSASTHVIDYPVTVNADDLLIVVFACDDDEATLTCTAFNQIYKEDAGAQGPTLYVGWRKAVGNEDGTTFNIVTGTAEGSCAYVFRITGADDPVTGQPPEASAEASGSSVNPNSASLTPTGGSKDYLFISAEGNDDDDNVTGYPSNMADNRQYSQQTTVTLGIATEEVTNSVFDPAQFTIAAAESWEAATIAVHPVGIPKAYKYLSSVDAVLKALGLTKTLTSVDAVLYGWFNGFEEGDFTAWDSNSNSGLSGDSHQVQSTIKRTDTYAGEFIVGAASRYAQARKSIAVDRDEVYISCHVYLDALPADGARHVFMTLLDTAAADVGTVRIWNNGGTYTLEWYGQTIYQRQALTGLSAQTWYYCEVWALRHATAGEVKVWWDTDVTPKIDVTGFDTDSGNPYRGVRVGNWYSSEACSNYIDDVTISVVQVGTTGGVTAYKYLNSVDAHLIGRIAKPLTNVDAILVNRLTKTLSSVDAHLVDRYTKTLASVDAVLQKKNIPKTLPSVDAILVDRLTKTLSSVDAVLVDRLTKTLTNVDAHLVDRFSLALNNVDAVLLSRVLLDLVNVDAVLVDRLTKALSNVDATLVDRLILDLDNVDAVLKKLSIPKTLSDVDAVLVNRLTLTLNNVDAVLIGTGSKQLTNVDAILVDRLTKTLSNVDATLVDRLLKTLTSVDATLVDRLTMTLANVDAFLVNRLTLDLDNVDAVLQQLNIAKALNNVDAVLVNRFTLQLNNVDAVLKSVPTKQLTNVDAVLVDRLTLDLNNVDAVLVNRLIKTLANVDAYLINRYTKTLANVDALLIGRIAKTFTADAHLVTAGVNYKYLNSVDAVLKLITTKQLGNVDATLVDRLTKTLSSVDAVLVDRLTLALNNVDGVLVNRLITTLANVDAVLKLVTSKQLTSVDAVLVSRLTKQLANVDAVLVDRLTKDLTSVDAVLISRLTKALANVDGVLVDRLTKQLSNVDAIVVLRFTKTFTADAVLFSGAATLTKTLLVDAIIVVRLLKTLTIDAVLEWKEYHDGMVITPSILERGARTGITQRGITSNVKERR